MMSFKSFYLIDWFFSTSELLGMLWRHIKNKCTLKMSLDHQHFSVNSKKKEQMFKIDQWNMECKMKFV